MAKVLEISVSHQFELASLLYEAACSVFKSLPPTQLLTNFDQATYDAWYEDNFSDDERPGAVARRSTSERRTRYPTSIR